MTPLVFDVAGVPVPQGSMRAGIIAGRARVIHSGPKVGPLHAWRNAIGEEARKAKGGSTELLTGPVAVRVSFRMTRPAGHVGKRGLLPSAPAYPVTAPDIDKLVRAVLDALTGVVFRDDSQVSALIVRKNYAEPGHQPGARIEVGERLVEVSARNVAGWAYSALIGALRGLLAKGSVTAAQIREDLGL